MVGCGHPVKVARRVLSLLLAQEELEFCVGVDTQLPQQPGQRRARAVEVPGELGAVHLRDEAGIPEDGEEQFAAIG